MITLIFFKTKCEKSLKIWAFEWVHWSLISLLLCVYFCAQQCNPGDLRALRKGMTLYHSETQLSSLPQRQDAMHVVSTQEGASLLHLHQKSALGNSICVPIHTHPHTLNWGEECQVSSNSPDDTSTGNLLSLTHDRKWGTDEKNERELKRWVKRGRMKQTRKTEEEE